MTHDIYETSTIIHVPVDKRPSLGARVLSLQMICLRGDEALENVVKRSIPELELLSQRLLEAATVPAEALSARDVAVAMMCANDLRGMASTMGSEITADIANFIYELCDEKSDKVSQPLILQLAKAARQVIGYRRNADEGRLKKRVDGLLADVRAAVGCT